jgi:hypothetical protein
VNARVLVVAVVALCSCGGKSARPGDARHAVRAEAVADLLPPDLDVVVRIGWPRLRASPLYAFALSALPDRAIASPLAAPLERARAVLVGVRVMPDGLRGDGVLVVETDATDLDIDRMLGGARERTVSQGLSVYEAKGQTARFDPSLVVVLANRGLLVATAAEADALLRTAQRGPASGRLEPPLQGLVSFALRSPAGANWAAGGEQVRALADGMRTAHGTLDLVDQGVRLQAEVKYETPEQAAACTARAKGILDAIASGGTRLAAAASRLKETARISAQAETVVVTATIPFELLVGRR